MARKVMTGGFIIGEQLALYSGRSIPIVGTSSFGPKRKKLERGKLARSGHSPGRGGKNKQSRVKSGGGEF